MSETIDKLLDAAESAIRLKGYHAVSFRDLAAELGIKSASVHYHFKQKEDLGLALVRRYSDRLFAALEENTANVVTSDERIATFCDLYRQALVGTDRLCLCGMLGAESCGLPDALAKAVSAFFQDNIDWVANALPADFSSKEKTAIATQVVSTLQGAMMMATSLQDQSVFDRASEEVMRSLAGRT